MKVIIPIPFWRKGGVERVIIALVSEISEHLEKTILVLPEKQIPYFQKLLPVSDAIAYEPLKPYSPFIESPISLTLSKLGAILKKIKLRHLGNYFDNYVSQQRYRIWLEHLIKKHDVSHCLYLLTNRLEPPSPSIPLAILAHDVFWRFAPLTYSDSYVKEYDDNLLKWLRKSDVVFTNSQKTKDDILSIFPEFLDKVEAIPLSGFSRFSENSNSLKAYSQTSSDKIITFYFPSSFGIYKDHLTLLKAGLKLIEKGHNFRVVLVGRETDDFIQGSLTLSQQEKTKEYIDYLSQCSKIYKSNSHLISKYFKGLGYCDYETVENCYQTCSCVVVPSKYEGFGLAVSEAIVRGLPVIASDLEVFKEQADLYDCHDRIAFFKQSDADELADCMEQFILQPKPHLSQEESRQRFFHWTWQNVAKRYVDLLQRLEHSSL